MAKTEKELNAINIHRFKDLASYEKHKEELSPDDMAFVKIDIEALKPKWVKIWEGTVKDTNQNYCKIPEAFNEVLLTFGYDNDGQKSFVFSLLITKEMWEQQNDLKVCNYESAMFCVPFGVNIYVVKATREVAMYDKFSHDNLVAMGAYYR